MAWVMEQSPDTLNGTEQSVAVALANYANDEGGSAFPSVAKLCRITHWTERTVVRALDTLEAKGIIEIERAATNKAPASYRFPAFRGVRDAPLGVSEMHPTVPLGVSESPSRGVRDAPKPSITVSTSPSGDDAPAPYAVFAAVCEASGLDPGAYSARDKGRHLAVCKRLIGDGVTEQEARALVGWLKSQRWRSGPVTAFTVEKEVGTWRAAGRPERETARPTSQADLNKGGTGKLVL